jgi:hypothetical protein
LGRLLPAALVLLTALGAPDASRAAWQSPGDGGQFARAITLPGGSTPSASVSGQSVTVSWSATSLPGGGNVTGYRVRRYSSGGVLQSIGAGCSGTVGATTCTETNVPAGSWRYAVVPVQGNWSGAESGQSAAVTVVVPTTTTITTSAWNLRDVSTTSPVGASAPWAFAGDGEVRNTGNWAANFSTSRYVEFDSNTTLPAGKAVTGAAFDFRRAASNAGDIVCFYVEVRRISTGAVLATHGGAASPLGCVTGTTLTTTSVPLPEISTTDLANDARVRVYSRSSGLRATTIDLATVSGSAAGTPFTLYTKLYADAATGASPTVLPWSQVAVDGTSFAAGGNWAQSFQSTRYLEYAFPAYVPSGASVTGAVLRHAYRPTTNGNDACWYAEAYSGGALIGTYGSTAAPAGCSSSSASFKTDTVSMPAVNSVARANDLTVRLYFRGSANGQGRRTEHDLTEADLTYAE